MLYSQVNYALRGEGKNMQRQHLEPNAVLQGVKVYMRQPRFEEGSFIRSLWADPETMAPVGGTHDLPETEFPAWFAKMVNPGDLANCYCLIFNQEDIPVGEISFHAWSQQQRTARLNIKVLAKYRGNGYAKDALLPFLAWFFGPAGGLTMTDDVGLDNHGGQSLLRSLGFEQDTDFSGVCMLVMTRQMYTAKYG
jgi:RimJ/RimL family protein N-acetyltransferase